MRNRKKLIIVLILLLINVYYSNSQDKIHKIFRKSISNTTLKDFSKKHHISKIIFIKDRDSIMSLSIDQNGNTIESNFFKNQITRKTKQKYDNLDREIEEKYYNPNGSFKFGYYYKYFGNTKTTFKIKDSIKFRTDTFLKDENIKIHSVFDKYGEIISKNIYVFDSKMRYISESRFRMNSLNTRYRFEYINGSTFITKIEYDKNGTKINEIRYLDEIEDSIKNQLKHYRKHDYAFRIDTFDSNNNLVKLEMFNKEGISIKVDTNKYNENQILQFNTFDYNKNEPVSFNYEYDKDNKLKCVIKKRNGKKVILYKFSYEFYN